MSKGVGRCRIRAQITWHTPVCHDQLLGVSQPISTPASAIWLAPCDQVRTAVHQRSGRWRRTRRMSPTQSSRETSARASASMTRATASSRSGADASFGSRETTIPAAAAGSKRNGFATPPSKVTSARPSATAAATRTSSAAAPLLHRGRCRRRDRRRGSRGSARSICAYRGPSACRTRGSDRRRSGRAARSRP